MNWINKKLKALLGETNMVQMNLKPKNGWVPVRRLNCYDEVEIFYVKKSQAQAQAQA